MTRSQADRPTVSVIVPVFGDGGELADLAGRTGAVLDAGHRTWEIVFVNDGSPGPAWDAIACLALGDRRIRGIDLQRNFGQHNALLAGIRASLGDVVVTMDDDLQHPPEALPGMLEALAAADVVYATPIDRVQAVGRHVAGVALRVTLASVLGAEHARKASAFRAFRGSLRPVFMAYESSHVLIDVLLNWATQRIVAVPVSFHERRRLRSGYGMRRLIKIMIDIVTGFSVWPLRLASIIGLASSLFGLLVLAFVLGRYLLAGTSVPGFPFLASVMAIFAGAQLFGLGVMGEYLARMYFRTMDRPPYLIRAVVNAPAVRE